MAFSKKQKALRKREGNNRLPIEYDESFGCSKCWENDRLHWFTCFDIFKSLCAPIYEAAVMYRKYYRREYILYTSEYVQY